MSALKKLSSERLLARLFELVQRSTTLEADLLEHLAEVDARRLYLREGCSSMFAYCVRMLRFAEAVAYKRIAAMRAARRHPELLTALRNGELHLTALSLLAPRLTGDNAPDLIVAARHRTAEEIRRMLADRKPKPDAVSTIRKLPVAALMATRRQEQNTVGAEPVDPTPEAPRLAPAAPSLQAPITRPEPTPVAPPEPLGGERYVVRFIANRELHAELRELQALMRHQIPDGDLGKILARAVGTLLKQVRNRKYGECSEPRAAAPTDSAPSRHIPAAIRRAVAKRDDERCAFISDAGRRCDSREFLEFHHCNPWARSRSHAIGGISLRCRAHNRYEAERDFGTEHMNRFHKKDRSSLTTPTKNSDPLTVTSSQLDLNPVGSRDSWLKRH
jgi:hypothetical protein